MSTKPPTRAPAIAPRVLAAYTRATVRPMFVPAFEPSAIARGNAAPRANVIGRRRHPTMKAWRITMRPNAASGPATSAATTNGRRDAVHHAAADAPTATTASVAASHVAVGDG